MKEFTHHDQPYGTKIIGNAIWTPITGDGNSPDYIKHCEKKGLGVVTGILTKGGDLIRLLGHSQFKSRVGMKHSVWAVSPEEWERGSKTTFTM